MAPPILESEIQIQAHCYQACWNTFPDTRYSLFAVPNGGTRDVREMGQLKASGLLAGVADLLLIFNQRAYCFEFKDAKGTQRPEQIKFQEQCQRQQIPYYIIRTPQEFWAHMLPIIRPQLQGTELETAIELLVNNPIEYAKQNRVHEPLRKESLIAQ